MSRAYELMMQGTSPERGNQHHLPAFFLPHETNHDVTLVATDGVRVSAKRKVLALRSNVFAAMLTGQFRETNDRTIDVNYPGKVVKALVQFIYTDNATIFAELAEIYTPDGRERTWKTDREEFQTLISLTDAAAYYDLRKLCLVANDCLSRYLNKYPMILSIELLEKRVEFGPAISGEVMELAQAIIRHNFFELFCEGDVLGKYCLSLLTIILRDNKIFQSEFHRFETVNVWAKNSLGDRQQSKSIAQSLVKDCIRLERINPYRLSNNVAPSGLVTMEAVLEAYKQQALGGCVERKPWIPHPMWRNSTTPILANHTTSLMNDTLACPPLRPGGVYRWMVEVNSLGPSVFSQIWLGVARSESFYSGGCQPNGCWGVNGYDGCVYLEASRKEDLGPDSKFGSNNDTVTLTLDLSPADSDNGSLSITVNGRAFCRAISEMKTKLGSCAGFYPAISCSGCAATIISIEAL
jgi:BTB/POZ domain